MRKGQEKGERVRKGTYLNLSNGEVVEFGAGGKKPEAGAKYMKFPSLLAVLGAPLIGLAYVIFLPLTGIGAIFVYVATKLKDMAAERAMKRVDAKR